MACLTNLDARNLNGLQMTSKRLIRAIKRSRLCQVRVSIWYEYSFEAPKDYNDALRIDNENGNTKRQDAIDLELDQIKEYRVSQDLGPAIGIKASHRMLPRITRRSRCTWCLLSNMMDATKLDLLLMDTSPDSLLKQFTQ